MMQEKGSSVPAILINDLKDPGGNDPVMSDVPFPYVVIDNVLWFGNRWILGNTIRKIILQVLGKGRNGDK